MTEALDREAPREWLIRKDGYFYRPNKQGYTTSKFEAGRYTERDAKAEAEIEPWHMSAVHQDAVADDPASAATSTLSARNAELEARVEAQAALIEQARSSGFDAGYTLAVANLIHLRDQPGMAADVMAQTGITLAAVNAMGLTDYDLKPLRKMFREENVLRGQRRARSALNQIKEATNGQV